MRLQWVDWEVTRSGAAPESREQRCRLKPRDSSVAAAHRMLCGVISGATCSAPSSDAAQPELSPPPPCSTACVAAVSCRQHGCPHPQMSIATAAAKSTSHNAMLVPHISLRARQRLSMACWGRWGNGRRHTPMTCCRRSARVAAMGLPCSHACCSSVHSSGCSA